MNPTDKKPKLIFLWTYTNWGGAQIYFFAIMKLAREAWDIVVALPRSSKPDLLSFLDQLEIRYDLLDWDFSPSEEITLTGKLRRQWARIRSEFLTFNYLRRFDLSRSVLHMEVAPWQSWLLLLALAIRRANVFATLHNFRPSVAPWRKLVWKFRLRIVSQLPGFHIFASNVDTKENLKGYVTPKFWAEIPVTYTCVDPEEIRLAKAAAFDRDSERSRFGVDQTAFVVLSVGQFIDRKGRWTLLEAAKSLDDIAFVWVMPEEPSDEDRIRIESYGLGNRFVPILSSSIGEDRPAILRFFRLADAFALPSFVEGLPIALLEAMAMGIPSISTNVYAIPEAIRHEETGLLIEAGDSKALAASIVRLRDEGQIKERIAQVGSAFVLEHFDERVAASTCIETYRRALSERGRFPDAGEIE